MKNIFTIALLLIVFFSISCNNKNSKVKIIDSDPKEFNDIVSLRIVDTINFSVSKKTNVFARHLSKEQIKGEDFLGLVNENTNDLEFYHLADSSKNFNIHFQKEGPNGVNMLKAFKVISDSTILIGGSFRSELYLSDFEGNIIQRINTVNKERADGKPFVQIYSTNRPFLIDQARKYAYQFAIVDQDYFSPGLWSGSYFVKVKISEGFEINHVLDFPESISEMVTGGYFSHTSHTMIKDNLIAVSLPFLSRLIIYDPINDTLSYAEAGHSSFGDIALDKNPQPEQDERSYIEGNSYREVAYDPMKGYLYRFAYQGVDYIDGSGKRKTWDNKIPSIVILDKQLQKVGEYELPLNHFYTRMYFMHNGKLYISINHPDNNPSEDDLIFIGLEPYKK